MIGRRLRDPKSTFARPVTRCGVCGADASTRASIRVLATSALAPGLDAPHRVLACDGPSMDTCGSYYCRSRARASLDDLHWARALERVDRQIHRPVGASRAQKIRESCS